MGVIIAILQAVFYVVFLICNFFFRARFLYKLSSSDFKKGMILAANHQSRLDFLLIYTGIPFHRFVRILPIYAPTAHKYMNTWWKKLILTLVGCISIDTSTKKHAAIGLLSVVEKAEQGNTILIFPEGMVTAASTAKVYDGVGYLLKKHKSTCIPISVNGFSKVTLGSFLLRRHAATITYGEPVMLNHLSVSELTKTVMESIRSL